jgi:endonuclease YncB( thermonuclease family)
LAGLIGAALGALWLGAALPAAALQGMVTRVSDGDTLWLRPASGARPVKLRLQGIDAPELCQPGGREARDALARLVLHQPVRVDEGPRDPHGRRLGRLMRGDIDLQAQLVRDGHAWSYRWRGNPGPYAAEEHEAHAARRGLFADPKAIEPREFRRLHGPCTAR